MIRWINSGKATIGDIKTASSIREREFFRDARKYLYHWQAAWYVRAAYFGYAEIEKVEQFQFWVVMNTPPFEAAVYAVKPQVLNHGWYMLLQAIERYKAWRQTGDRSPQFGAARWLEIWIDEPSAIPNPPLHPRENQ